MNTDFEKRNNEELTTLESILVRYIEFISVIVGYALVAIITIPIFHFLMEMIFSDVLPYLANHSGFAIFILIIPCFMFFAYYHFLIKSLTFIVYLQVYCLEKLISKKKSWIIKLTLNKFLLKVFRYKAFFISQIYLTALLL